MLNYHLLLITMQEFLFFLSGFILCLIYFKIKQKNKIIPANTSAPSSDNTLASEQKVLDQIPDQIIIINREKNIIFANKSSLERFGKNIEQNHIA